MSAKTKYLFRVKYLVRKVNIELANNVFYLFILTAAPI